MRTSCHPTLTLECCSRDRLPRATIYEEPPHAEVRTWQGRLLASHYAPWIAADFARWNASGITKVLKCLTV